MPLTVRDIMEIDVPAVYPEDPIEQVVQTMRRHELPGIPVINEGGGGIITEAAQLIAREKHNRLPVIEHGPLVGVVPRIDVLDILTAE
jgi:CBS domain-containing protein